MPGDTSMRDQTSDKDRRKFTSGLIRAIEDLELRRINRSPQQLADAAWQKLQYDFPLVETEELQALLGAFRYKDGSLTLQLNANNMQSYADGQSWLTVTHPAVLALVSLQLSCTWPVFVDTLIMKTCILHQVYFS